MIVVATGIQRFAVGHLLGDEAKNGRLHYISDAQVPYTAGHSYIVGVIDLGDVVNVICLAGVGHTFGCLYALVAREEVAFGNVYPTLRVLAKRAELDDVCVGYMFAHRP